MEEEAEATLSNSKSKKEWFLDYCDQYLPENKAKYSDTGYSTGYRNKTMVLHH